jgi:hypothetical protein
MVMMMKIIIIIIDDTYGMVRPMIGQSFRAMNIGKKFKKLSNFPAVTLLILLAYHKNCNRAMNESIGSVGDSFVVLGMQLHFRLGSLLITCNQVTRGGGVNRT